jgi:hypothetical protein
LSRRRLLVLAFAAIVQSAPARAQPAEDPRALFASGQYAAAAAGFESLWQQRHDFATGINAVIAWRSAGKYAHARVLLDTLARGPVPAEYEARVRLLRTRLESLTASVSLQGDPLSKDAVVRIDNAPAVRLGRDLVAQVGRRQLSVEQPGCNPFRWQGVLRPGQRVPVVVRLVCPVTPGSLHITLNGGAFADIRVDGKPVPPQEPYDSDLSLAPGDHQLEVIRRGIVVHSAPVTIASAAKTNVRVDLHWRSKATGLVAAASGFAWTGPMESTAAGAVTLGYFRSLEESPEKVADARVGMLFLVHFGVAATDLGLPGPRVLMGVSGGVQHLLPPVWQARTGSTLWVLDVEPGLMTFSVSPKTQGKDLDEKYDSITHWGFTPVVLTTELPFLHLETAFWPVGIASHTDRRWGDADLKYGFGLSLTAGWSALGF